MKNIPATSGIGLRQEHFAEIVKKPKNIDWVEIHSENFFAKDSYNRHVLDIVAQEYPLSLHGVGLSLGSADPLNKKHLQKLKELVDCYKPALVSEHVSWSSVDGNFVNDLLPLPYTQEALEAICSNIKTTQEFLGRQILVENPSTYLEFTTSEMPEYEFLNQIVGRTGCGLLLDINNIYVIHKNHGVDMQDYLNNIDKDAIHEFHLAGHAVKELPEKTILIDHHGDFIADPVWNLYKQATQIIGIKPTLIEWDTDVPALGTLIGEANKANKIAHN